MRDPERLLDMVSEMRLFKRAGNLGTPDKLRFYLDRLLEGVPLEGATVLDVGAGTGVFSFWAAANGARLVRSLEPELAGGADTMNAIFRRIATRMGYADVVLSTETLQQLDPTAGPFDLILMHNSVNHLDESACRSLPAAWAIESYASLFAKCRALLRAGGVMLIADCSRRNLFGDLGVRNPLAPTIDWAVHQAPGVWRRLAEDCGFKCQRLTWTTMSALGGLGALLFDNAVAGYCTFGHFVLSMRVSD